jgi:soluble P-type ATPase
LQTYEYKHQRDIFDSKARAWTRQHAVQMKHGEAAVAAEAASPTAAANSQQYQKQQQQLEVLEDEKIHNPSSSTDEKGLLQTASKVATISPVDTEKENGNAGKQKQLEEVGKPSLDKASINMDTSNFVAGTEPPQKKSKLSLRR